MNCRNSFMREANLPSFMRMTRFAAAAMSAACVASRTVTPSSCSIRRCSASTLAPFSESRLPVGSSATSSAGPMHQRAGDRGALHLAAGDLLRVMRQPVRDADALAQARGARDSASSWLMPASRQGSAMFSSDASVSAAG